MQSKELGADETHDPAEDIDKIDYYLDTKTIKRIVDLEVIASMAWALADWVSAHSVDSHSAYLASSLKRVIKQLSEKSNG